MSELVTIRLTDREANASALAWLERKGVTPVGGDLNSWHAKSYRIPFTAKRHPGSNRTTVYGWPEDGPECTPNVAALQDALADLPGVLEIVPVGTHLDKKSMYRRGVQGYRPQAFVAAEERP